MTCHPYPTTLTDVLWRRLAPLIPSARPGGRPRAISLCEILNAIFSHARGGASWRLLPPVTL